MKYAILTDKTCIKLSGPDSVKLLDSITSNQINTESITYTLMLSAQGRYLVDLFVYPLSNQQYLLEVAKTAKTRALELLNKYKMRNKITIEDTQDKYLCIYAECPIAQIAFKDPRHAKLQFKSILSIDTANLANLELEPNLYNIDKYTFCIPEGESELKVEKSFPQEYGIDKLNGISYTKGCYIGQEVIARTKYQGVIRKKVYLVGCDTDFTDTPDGTKILFQHNQKQNNQILPWQEIGFICSSWQQDAIALLKDVDINISDGKLKLQLNEKRIYIKVNKS